MSLVSDFKELLGVDAQDLNIELPSQVFFTPNEGFWDIVRSYVAEGIKFVDCGCGMGALIEQGQQRGIEIGGIDIGTREGQHSKVVHGDALELRWSPTLWPLVCRPSHDGWVHELFEIARCRGAGALYVGLPCNYHRDLSGLGAVRVAGPAVGAEGEHIYTFNTRRSS